MKTLRLNAHMEAWWEKDRLRRKPFMVRVHKIGKFLVHNQKPL